MAYSDSSDVTGDMRASDWQSGEVRDYAALLKPRVMSLVVFTAFVGLAIAPGSPHPVIALASLLAIAVGAGASASLNMWYDADIDAVMRRTAMRPVPSGRVPAEEALAIGLALSFGSVATLGLIANWVAAGLLAFTIFFYAVVYTMWLKRWTPQNIVIGGAAGAMPPVIGWAAATGEISTQSLLLFAVIFLWTPPHFWALSLYRSDDYRAAGVPMLPVVQGHAAAKRQILAYAVLLAIVAPLPALFGMATMVYGVVAAALGGLFVWLAWQTYRMADDDRQMAPARNLFRYSLLYLFLLFAILLVEQGLWVVS